MVEPPVCTFDPVMVSLTARPKPLKLTPLCSKNEESSAARKAEIKGFGICLYSTGTDNFPPYSAISSLSALYTCNGFNNGAFFKVVILGKDGAI